MAGVVDEGFVEIGSIIVHRLNVGGTVQWSRVFHWVQKGRRLLSGLLVLVVVPTAKQFVVPMFVVVLAATRDHLVSVIGIELLGSGSLGRHQDGNSE